MNGMGIESIEAETQRMRWILDSQRISPSGVIYAGANVGEHVPVFRALGFKRILAIEPNPDAFARLQENVGKAEDVRCVNAAVSDHEGTIPFYAIPAIPTLNSILPLDKEFWQHQFGVSIDDIVKASHVPAKTLDSLIDGRDEAFNVLYMNIQGAELLALKGAIRCLAKVDAVFTEVNFHARYTGSTTFSELDSFLRGAGMELTYLQKYLPPQQKEPWLHGEALYVSRAHATRTAVRL
jgi:FkbM family methyltransferase